MAETADTYVNGWRAPVDIANGRMLAPGDSVTAKDLDLEDGSHDSRLVEEGRLLAVPAEKPRPSRARKEDE